MPPLQRIIASAPRTCKAILGGRVRRGKGGCTRFRLYGNGGCPLFRPGKGDSPLFAKARKGYSPLCRPLRDPATAKNPKLASKFQNMPVTMTAETVDRYMRPILDASRTGRFDLIRNIDQ